jgi:hypothetical protein
MFLIVAAIAGFAIVANQGCFYHSNGPDQYEQQHGSGRYEQQYGSGRTVCDADGRNCMVCDDDNRNCRRIDSQHGSSQRRSWGFWW